MKNSFVFLCLVLIVTSCCTHKLMKTVSDIKKIETNKAGFIGQPLKSLLLQISPQIKFVYGNPENRYRRSIGDTYLKFHFFDKKEAQKLFSTNHTPTGLIVELVSDENNHHKPLPKGGLNEWTKENTKEYGDMIIQNIKVVGEN